MYKPKLASPDRAIKTRVAALIAAGILTVMLVCQLYGYENFASVLMVSLPVMDDAQIQIAAAAIVLVELVALPFLLGMYVSPLMRIVSMTCAVLTSLVWLFTALTSSHASNTGLLSDTLTVPGGLLAFVVSIVIFCSISYVLVQDIRHVKGSA